jgi:hypothetical protein
MVSCHAEEGYIDRAVETISYMTKYTNVSQMLWSNILSELREVSDIDQFIIAMDRYNINWNDNLISIIINKYRSLNQNEQAIAFLKKKPKNLCARQTVQSTIGLLTQMGQVILFIFKINSLFLLKYDGIG